MTGVESYLGIGELARASGLPVSALRFYDGAGVLVPASVDARTGYRRYGTDQVRTARLVARLRRVGMPLADVRALLAGADPGPVLDAHLARLEGGLADARRELSAVRSLLDRTETPVTVVMSAAELAEALDAVRYAVGSDPDRPVLQSVLLERDGDRLRLVATDRYRLAVGSVPARGADVRVALPLPLVDAARALLAGASGPAVLDVSGDEVGLEVGGRSARGTAAAGEYPDWRRLEPDPGPLPVPVDVPAFRAALAAAPGVRKVRQPGDVPYETVVLVLGPGGELAVAGPDDEEDTGSGVRIGFARDFLLDALAAAGSDQLLLEVDGPVTPLAVRVPGGPDWSLLMPVDLDDPPRR